MSVTERRHGIMQLRFSYRPMTSSQFRSEKSNSIQVAERQEEYGGSLQDPKDTVSTVMSYVICGWQTAADLDQRRGLVTCKIGPKPLQLRHALGLESVTFWQGRHYLSYKNADIMNREDMEKYIRLEVVKPGHRTFPQM